MGRIRTAEDIRASIFELLTIDHRDVEALFDQIEATIEDDPAEAHDLFEVLRQSLLAHSKAEEAAVYARFAEIPTLTAKIDEARDEHLEVETVLDELEADNEIDDGWMARFRELKGDVLHHVQEEEGEVFTIAKDHVDAAESRRLAAAFLEEKEGLTGEDEREHATVRRGQFTEDHLPPHVTR